MKAIFEVKIDDNGNTGLIFKGAPSNFDTVDLGSYKGYGFNPANLIVHDLIEHDFKRDNGSVECELMALGAAMYGRANHGEIEVKGLLSDIVNCARDCNLEIEPTNKGLKQFEPIQWQIEELENYNLIKNICFELDMDRPNKEVKEFVKYAFRYIRQGARRAEKRFGNSSSMVCFFSRLSSEIMQKGKYIEEYEQLIVNFCFKKQSYKVEVKNIYNDWE
jgi:hypothetical protein